MRNKLLYIIFLLGAIWIYMVYEDYSAFLFLFVLLMVTIVSFVLSRICSFFVKVHLVQDNISVAKNGQITLKLHARNLSPFPFLKLRVILLFKGNYMDDVKKIEVICGLQEFKKNEITIDLGSDYIGRFDVSIYKCYVYDLFSILRFKVKSKGNTVVYVMPLISTYNVEIRETEFETENETDRYDENRPGSDSSHVFGIREYVMGDKLQRIHWKLSAKKDETYVKEFGYPISISTALYFDLHFTESDMEKKCDELVERLCNLSASLIKAEVYHYISWYSVQNMDIKMREIFNEEDLWAVIYEILNIKAHKEVYDDSYYKNKYGDEFINLIYVNEHEIIEEL